MTEKYDYYKYDSTVKDLLLPVTAVMHGQHLVFRHIKALFHLWTHCPRCFKIENVNFLSWSSIYRNVNAIKMHMYTLVLSFL